MLRQRKESVPSSTRTAAPAAEIGSKNDITGVLGFKLLHRISLTLFIPVVVSIIFQVAPRLVEPLYGNVLTVTYFLSCSLAALFFGGLAGRIYVNRVLKSNNDMHSKEAVLTETSNICMGLCGLCLSLSPLSVQWMLTHSDILSPQLGPHVAQLMLAYPVYFIISFAYIIGYNLRSFEKSTLSWVIYTVMQWIIGVGLVLLFYRAIPMNMSCQVLFATGLVIGVIPAVFTVFSQTYGIPGAVVLTRKRWRVMSLWLVLELFIVAAGSYNILYNPQCQPGLSPMHNHASSSYRILARNESLTGWISVVDELTPRYGHHVRALRAGHSLIGGIYVETGDSVFASFYLMEAVRLVENGDRQKTEVALQIGLGIGVAAAGLMQQSVLVDVVEIDPVVIDYAMQFFNFPVPRAVYIEDGREYIKNAPADTYDYVLHDVFTGGSAPPHLFSLEALQHIKRIMKPDGILSVNYVGSEKWPKSRGLHAVYHTLGAVFEYVMVFKEDPDNKDGFQNMVLFASDFPLAFRMPIKQDFAGSGMREHMLENMEQWKLDMDFGSRDGFVMADNNSTLNEMQIIGASEHWKAMRQLFPLSFWLNY